MKIDFKTRSLNFAKAFWPLDAPARKRQIFWLKRAAIAFGLLLIVANLFSPARHDELDIKEGGVSNHDIAAPFDFPVLKYPEELAAHQDSAEQNVLAIAYRSPEVDNKILGDIDRFLVKLSDLREEDEYLTVKRKKLESWGLNLSPATVNLLLSLPELYPFQQGLHSISRQAVSAGILPLSDEQTQDLGNQIVIRDQDQLLRTPVQDLVTAQSLPLLMKIKSEQAFPKSALLAQAAAEVASGLLVPNLNLDLDEVNNARALARHNVSLAVGQVSKGERLVAAYQRIDAPAAQKLYSLKLRLDEIALSSRRGGWRYFLTLLSRLLALGFFLGILIIYLYRF
ncbi:MAG: hypothetical protein Q8O74_08765, partial [bacterium]|nr:hypothetical protein [bacterium]